MPIKHRLTVIDPATLPISPTIGILATTLKSPFRKNAYTSVPAQTPLDDYPTQFDVEFCLGKQATEFPAAYWFPCSDVTSENFSGS